MPKYVQWGPTFEVNPDGPSSSAIVTMEKAKASDFSDRASRPRLRVTYGEPSSTIVLSMVQAENLADALDEALDHLERAQDRGEIQ